MSITARVGMRAAAAIAAGVIATGTAGTAAAQGAPQLRISAIANQGALKVGMNTFRVNVQNSSHATPAKGPVTVTLEVLDPQQKKTEYTVTLNGVPAGQNSYQPAWFRTVAMDKPGAYTISAIVDPEKRHAHAYPNDGNRRTQVFTVGGDTAAHRLIVTVKNANGTVANGLRVSLKSHTGQELFWKFTAGVGQADFPKVAPSPDGKPYTILVTAAALVKATQPFTMPAKDEILAIHLP